MAEDNEWHTVTSSKATPVVTQPSSKPRRKSKHTPKTTAKPSSTSTKPSSTTKPTSTTTKQTHNHKKPTPKSDKSTNNPFHIVNEEDDSEDEEGDDELDPMDLPVPLYHTSIVVMCPFDCDMPVPFLDTTSLVKHLNDQHRLAFKNLHHMYMALDAYLARWAKVFSSKTVSGFGEPDAQDKDVYVIDPEKCELDKEIRDDMQRAKLNEVLKIQQDERETESKVPRKCLFCKIICDTRAVLFKHMFAEHNFNIGLPDNLVHVNEFLDSLEAKLSNLQCLYCEKTFTSPAVLRKHMRKKKHFKIASRNRQYDRFYVINYLEPGKNWESFENDNYESDDEKKDESWADWEEDVQESTMCLFDSCVLGSPKEALAHMKSAHNFDLAQLRKDKGLDFYQIIALINYIRHQNSLGSCFSCSKSFHSETELVNHLEESECISIFVPMDASFWKDPKYLIPTYENDPLLTGFEQDEEDEDDLSQVM